MMSDDKITFRVDSDTKRRLGGEHTNLSGVMRNLAEKYARTGDTVEASLLVEREEKENRRRELKREKGDIEAEISKIDRDLERIDRRLEQHRQNTPDEAIELAENIAEGYFPRDNLTPDNLAVKNKATNAGLEIEAFIHEVKTTLDDL